jgi:glycosyltransferase involved in cell wall biosynthesis
MEGMERDRTHPPLRILLVADSLAVGGAERHVVALARGLAERGHVVTLACAMSGPLASSLDGTSVRVLPLMARPAKREFSPAFALALERLLRHERFDLVHAHMFASQVAAAAAVQETAVPLVLTEHSEGTWQKEWDRRLLAAAHQGASRSIAVSAGIEARLQRDLAVPADRIARIPNALPPFGRDDVHRLLPRDPVRPLVGVVARLTPEKGVDVFLEAAALVAPQNPGARFLIVGDGPERQRLEMRVDRFGITDRIHFLGAVPDARPVIASLDVLAVPSRSEGSPLVVLEAAALGTAVVASCTGDIPRQLAGRGILVPPGSAPVLAAGILLALNREQREVPLARAEMAARYVLWLDRTVAVYRSSPEERLSPLRGPIRRTA